MIKERIGGKYVRRHKGDGYYGRDEAGNIRYFGHYKAGIPREFIGSDSKLYTFQDLERGTRTIVASSYPEALRIAESMGFTASDYKKRRGKR